MRSLVVLFAVIAVMEGHVLKRSIGEVVYALPSAVSHQSRVDVHNSPAVVADAVVAEPVIQAQAVIAPAVYTGGSAVSHQARYDVHSYPAVVQAAPAVIAEPVVEAASVFTAPVATVYGASAVSHQSRTDVHSSPAVVTEELVAPAVVDARSVWPSVYTSW